jgi:hypothetical protein
VKHLAALLPLSALALSALALSAPARAATFDAAGQLRLDPAATATIDFESEPVRYLPADTPANCADPMYTVVPAPDALEGGAYASLKLVSGCAERLAFDLPEGQASYRATMWARHGTVDASVVVLYADGAGLDWTLGAFSPTGRTTSDGWVELATNDFSVDGDQVAHAYVKLVSYAADAVHLDGVEVVPSGAYRPQRDCDRLGDAACGADAVCLYNRCVPGAGAVPVLPAEAIRDEVVDVLASQLRVFYGGQRSRALYLPKALAELEAARHEKTAWAFWSRWVNAIHLLHDWHTDTNMSMSGAVGPKARLNACFIEGDADLSHAAWPSEPGYPDILVSHVGPDAGGLAPGDRLLAVDGKHPIAWAEDLWHVDWGFHIGTDPRIYADYAEALGGPPYQGLIIKFAHDITVLRCQPNGPCADEPETLLVKSLANGGAGSDVSCDNRPSYHLQGGGPDPTKHRVFGHIYTGAITGTTPDEAIFGMVWDTLNGNGSPTSPVNSALSKAITDWKANARGVILDHRAGNGGTLDSATLVTTLARPPEVVAAMLSPIPMGGFPGPASPADGLALFQAGEKGVPYPVGAADWAADLPVALVIHRDGSASDYMPYGMKGAPNVRIFGPHATVGAFSTFIQFAAWGGLVYQFASGDTISKDGAMLIGHGVEPDETILPRQSDLVAGKDTLHEAALAWVRAHLKP